MSRLLAGVLTKKHVTMVQTVKTVNCKNFLGVDLTVASNDGHFGCLRRRTNHGSVLKGEGNEVFPQVIIPLPLDECDCLQAARMSRFTMRLCSTLACTLLIL